MTHDEILSRFANIKGRDHQHTGRCPTHEDRQNSLSITLADDGKTLLYCHADKGCTAEGIAGAVGLELRDLFPEHNGHVPPPRRTSPAPPPIARKRASDEPLGPVIAHYPYEDETGHVLYEIRRHEPKTFRPWRETAPGQWRLGLPNEARHVLYHLPEVREAAAEGRRVYYCAGEKDADRVRAHGHVATTHAFGESPDKFRPEYRDQLRGITELVVLVDNDDTGRSHAQNVGAKALGVVETVKVLALPGLAEHGDVSDYLDTGHTMADVDRLAEATPRWQPTAAPKPIGVITAARLAALRLGPPWRLPTGFPSLDARLGGGLRKGRVLVVGAATGVGKSLFSLEVSRRAARRGEGVLLVSREMSEDEISERFLAQTARVRALAFQDASLTPEEWQAAERAQTQTENDPLWIDQDSQSVEDVIERLDAWPYRAPVTLLVVDYLQLMRAPKDVKERRLQVEHVSASLKRVSLARQLVVIVPSSLNRYGIEDGVPTLGALRDSAEIEHDADQILLLWTTTPEAPMPMIEWHLAKNRQGRRGVGQFRFRSEFVTLEDPAAPWREPEAQAARDPRQAEWCR